MWARRALRAGWLLAPILAFPGSIWTSIRKDIAFSIYLAGMSLFGVSAIFGIISVGVTAKRNTESATAEQITAALKGNACLIDLVPRRQAGKGRPITVGELKMAKYDCERFLTEQQLINEQKAAMEAAKK